MNKRPIDIMRESGGSFRIEFDDDKTPIVQMCKLNDALLFITEKCVYEMVLADRIDPKRENPNLPHNIQRRILEIGADSELLGRTLLTASNLFNEKFLPSNIENKKAMNLTFDALLDLVDMSNASVEFADIEEKEIQVMQQRRHKTGSFALPSISDAITRAKSFIQKADHVQQAIIDLIRLFNVEIKRGHFETILKKLDAKYGNKDEYVLFLNGILPFMKMIRCIRDCLDHRNAKGAKIMNFTIHPDGSITPPLIEMDFRDAKLEPVSLSLFMSQTLNNMLHIIENLMAFLCTKHVQSVGNFPIQVWLIPENHRRNKFVKFGYCTNIMGQWMPIG